MNAMPPPRIETLERHQVRAPFAAQRLPAAAAVRALLVSMEQYGQRTPAWLEEYGRAVLEGLACGTPSLVSTAVGAAEVMTAEGVPELIEGWDETTWAQRALDVLRDPSRMEAMRAAGLQMAKNYSRERRLDALRLLLEELGPSGR
jgi:glycosyltransferase involved in cell wall biosynthesis